MAQLETISARSDYHIDQTKVPMRFGAVDFIRVLAACGVIWAHLPGATQKEFGHAGLIAFVLISVVFQVLGSEKQSFVDFMGRRSWRILVPWFGWFLIYGIFNRLKGEDLFPFSEGCLMDLLTGPWIGLWYLPFILLVAPVVFGLCRLTSRMKTAWRALLFALSGFLVLWTSAMPQGEGGFGAPLDQWIQTAAAVPLGMAIGFSVLMPSKTRSLCLCLIGLMVGVVCTLLLRTDRGAAISYGLAAPVVAAGFGVIWSAPSAIRAAGDLCLGVYLVHAIIIAVMKLVPIKPMIPSLLFGVVVASSFLSVFLMRRVKVLKRIL